jgi:hypothetical protein
MAMSFQSLKSARLGIRVATSNVKPLAEVCDETPCGGGCAMKSINVSCFMRLGFMLFASALVGIIFVANRPMQGQNAPDSSRSSQTTQPSGTQASERDADQATERTFTGVIAKSGDQLVLTDPLTKTSYQLDDQRKAHELVNKNVRVTGVLDPSTGTIRVSAIDPI